MRITPRVIWNAYKIDKLLPLLLTECRTLENAQLELKWLKEKYPNKKTSALYTNDGKRVITGGKMSILLQSCKMRQRHYPLQYILNDQPFGDLDILCKPGVLIPRWETEEWCFKLSDCFKSTESLVTTHLDLCTGTGCILLLLRKNLNIMKSVGLDISEKAISLSQENYKHNIDHFEDNPDNMPILLEKDILLSSSSLIRKNDTKDNQHYDIVTCNPPYINDFIHSRSVKLYEPKIALYGDLEFYENFISKWSHRTDSFVYELNSIHQAQYMRKQLSLQIWNVGIYKDSNEKIRCVYGYKKQDYTMNKNIPYDKVFKKFGILL